MPRTGFDPTQPRWPEGMPGVGGQWKPRGVPNAFLALLEFQFGDMPAVEADSPFGSKVAELATRLGSENFRSDNALQALQRFQRAVHDTWPTNTTIGDHPSPADQLKNRIQEAIDRAEIHDAGPTQSGAIRESLVPPEAEVEPLRVNLQPVSGIPEPDTSASPMRTAGTGRLRSLALVTPESARLTAASMLDWDLRHPGEDRLGLVAARNGLERRAASPLNDSLINQLNQRLGDEDREAPTPPPPEEGPNMIVESEGLLPRSEIRTDLEALEPGGLGVQYTRAGVHVRREPNGNWLVIEGENEQSYRRVGNAVNRVWVADSNARLQATTERLRSAREEGGPSAVAFDDGDRVTVLEGLRRGQSGVVVPAQESGLPEWNRPGNRVWVLLDSGDIEGYQPAQVSHEGTAAAARAYQERGAETQAPRPAPRMQRRHFNAIADAINALPTNVPRDTARDQLEARLMDQGDVLSNRQREWVLDAVSFVPSGQRTIPRQEIAQSISTALAATNDRFDADRFREAATGQPGPAIPAHIGEPVPAGEVGQPDLRSLRNEYVGHHFEDVIPGLQSDGWEILGEDHPANDFDSFSARPRGGGEIVRFRVGSDSSVSAIYTGPWRTRATPEPTGPELEPGSREAVEARLQNLGEGDTANFPAIGTHVIRTDAGTGPWSVAIDGIAGRYYFHTSELATEFIWQRIQAIQGTAPERISNSEDIAIGDTVDAPEHPAFGVVRNASDIEIGVEWGHTGTLMTYSRDAMQERIDAHTNPFYFYPSQQAPISPNIEIRRRLEATRHPETLAARSLAESLQARGMRPQTPPQSRNQIETAIEAMQRGETSTFGVASVHRTTHGTWTVTSPPNPPVRGISTSEEAAAIATGSGRQPFDLGGNSPSNDLLAALQSLTPGDDLRLSDDVTVHRTTHGSYTVRVRGQRARRGVDSRLTANEVVTHASIQQLINQAQQPSRELTDPLFNVGDRASLDGIDVTITNRHRGVTGEWTYEARDDAGNNYIEYQERNFVPAAPQIRRSYIGQVQVGDRIRLHGYDTGMTITRIGDDHIYTQGDPGWSGSEVWSREEVSRRMASRADDVEHFEITGTGGAGAPASESLDEASLRLATEVTDTASWEVMRDHVALAQWMVDQGIPGARVESSERYSRIVVDGVTVAYVYQRGRYRIRETTGLNQQQARWGNFARVSLAGGAEPGGEFHGLRFQEEPSTTGQARLYFAPGEANLAASAVAMSAASVLSRPERPRRAGRRRTTRPRRTRRRAPLTTPNHPGMASLGPHTLGPSGRDDPSRTEMGRSFSFEDEVDWEGGPEENWDNEHRKYVQRNLLNALENAGFGVHRTPMNWGHYSTNDFINFLATYDGTIEGAEIKTPIAYGEDGERFIQEAWAAMNEQGLRPGPASTEGMHVHIDARDIPEDVQRKVAQGYERNRDLFDLVVNPERYGAGYAMPGAERGHGEAELNYGGRHGTIEFRRQASTADADEMLDWMRMCRALVNHTIENGAIRERENLEELLDLFGDRLPEDSKRRLLAKAEETVAGMGGGTHGPRMEENYDWGVDRVHAPRSSGAVRRRLESVATLSEATLRNMGEDDPRYRAAKRELERRQVGQRPLETGSPTTSL